MNIKYIRDTFTLSNIKTQSVTDDSNFHEAPQSSEGKSISDKLQKEINDKNKFEGKQKSNQSNQSDKSMDPEVFSDLNFSNSKNL